jgi:hypothetical protein
MFLIGRPYSTKGTPMRKLLLVGVSASLLLTLYVASSGCTVSEAGVKDEAEIAHMVYFTLKDNSPTAKGKLVDACKKYLTKHTGEVFFRAGPRAVDFKRSVNDLDFDVSLHIVFKNKEAHDQYEEAPRHKEFIEENKANWKKVRVFDSVVMK